MAARVLHLTSPLQAGPDVLTLQKRLKGKGYDPGILDGRYGPTTSHAVRVFQKTHGLAVDGAYGPATAKALTAATVKPPAKPAAAAATKGAKALAEALKHLGVKESPAGSNRQPFGVWFGVDGVAWCAIFTSSCFEIGAGVVLGKGLTAAAGGYPKGIAYVPTLEAWLRTTGQWIGRAAPQPGDIAIFNWDGGVADHVGIVKAYLGGGKFQTVEGNTGIGADSDGGQVMVRERVLGQVNGFGRIR
jgi:cell wall-associated NlpC family hydrolase